VVHAVPSLFLCCTRELRSVDRCLLTEAYLDELGLERREPDVGFLDDIVSRHVARFAFCNVGLQLQDPLPLDLPPLKERIVIRGRGGGYCFDQNGLNYEILEELGFTVRLCLARLIYSNLDFHPGLTLLAPRSP
jgi:N-hydroxyarylamine O-acetyltransferase